jgi:hypothetical protein
MTNELLKKLARLYLPVYLFESETMKIIYAGYSTIKRNYYIRLIMGRDKSQNYLERRSFRKIPDLIKDYNVDMVIAEISPIALNKFQKFDGYIFPEWTNMRIKIDRPISQISKESAADFSDIKRRIRKFSQTYEILTDQESLNYFNDKFYIPYISKRHGEEAWIDDLHEIWKAAVSPMILFIKENDVIVGASLNIKTEDSFCIKRLGLLDGNEEYLKHGVVGALYYFGILEANKMKCKYFDLGGTRPFLSDGLTKFKMGLGGEFVTDLSPSKEYLWLGINNDSSVTKEFMPNVMHVTKDYKLVRYGTR